MMIKDLKSLKNVAHINIQKHLSLNMLPQSISKGKKAHLARGFILLFYFVNLKLAALYSTLHETWNLKKEPLQKCL